MYRLAFELFCFYYWWSKEWRQTPVLPGEEVVGLKELLGLAHLQVEVQALQIIFRITLTPTWHLYVDLKDYMNRRQTDSRHLMHGLQHHSRPRIQTLI